MKLLVTGGAGFIGSNFIHHWLKTHPEDSVVNLDVLTYAGNIDNLSEVSENPRYSFIQGDIRDIDTVRKAMLGVDLVVHFAAETHVDRSVSGPADFITTNLIGTFNLLEVARECNLKHFHHVSTDEVYGSLPLGTPDIFDEQTKYDPHSPYSASKAGSDHLVMAYYHTFGLPVTLTNTSNNYGPRQYPEKLIPVFVLKALKGEKLPIYGNGENVRDWIHVADHCAGIDLVIQKGRKGETYCLGGNAQRTNKEIATTILQELGLPEDQIEYVQDRPGHDLRYAIDSSKAEQELGWTRNHDFASGMAATVAWYKERAGSLQLDEAGIHTK